MTTWITLVDPKDDILKVLCHYLFLLRYTSVKKCDNNNGTLADRHRKTKMLDCKFQIHRISGYSYTSHSSFYEGLPWGLWPMHLIAYDHLCLHIFVQNFEPCTIRSVPRTIHHHQGYTYRS